MQKLKKLVAFLLSLLLLSMGSYSSSHTQAADRTNRNLTVRLTSAGKARILSGKTDVTKKTVRVTTGDRVMFCVEKNSKIKSVTYQSSNKKVVSVTKTGKVDIKKSGTAGITVTINRKNGKTISCQVKLRVIPDRSDENAYFLSTNSDFYEKVACNPIDQNYVIDKEAAPLEIWQSALKKCEAWNQQIDFTGSRLEQHCGNNGVPERLLSKADYDQLQNAISLWHEYYQEEVYQNRELYGNNGMIPGSMYTAVSADVLIEKCKLTSFTLLSHEYELTNNVSFAENTTAANNDSAYALSPQSFCIEYSSDFEKMLSSYSINEKNSDELEELIHETADKIEAQFGHDFTEHTNKYVSFIHALYTIENDLSEDSNLCLILKENRLKLYTIELLNILYMIDSQ